MSMVFTKRFSDLKWSRLRRSVGLLLPYLHGQKRLMTAAFLCGTGAMLMQVLRPWPIKILFDAVLIPSSAVAGTGWLERLRGIPTDTLVASVAASLLVIAGLWGLLSYGQAFLTASAGQKVVHFLRRRVYAHLTRLSLKFHRKRQRGDLLMRMTGDINVLRDGLVDSLLRGLAELLLLAIMASIMLVMDWRLALLSLALLPLLVLTMFRFSGEIRNAARRQRRNEGRMASMVSETLEGIVVIQAFGHEGHQDERFKGTSRMSLKAGLKTTRLEASMARSVEILLAAGLASVLWYGVHRVLAGALTPGDLLVFTSYVHSTYRPLRRLGRISSRLSKATVCAERLGEVLREEPEVRDLPGAKRARDIKGRIEARGVTFAYPGEEDCLKSVSFEIEPGQFVGLVGPSGAGKSTLMALLLRLYDPEEGRITIDGRDLRRYRVQSVRDQMAVVLQEPILFGGTIRENIEFGKLGATSDEVEQAARLANAHDFIEKFPDGYDSKVAEMGANLSGGQRQRITIARAFIRDAPILLLDEPTFGLDASAEAEVTEALERLMRGRTTIVVAHRLASLGNADRILVMKRGRIRECGTHDELVEADDWYSRNWKMQVEKNRPAAAGARTGQP
jgi:ABC-type multidrug transport system fused ATPase/permease subunit